MSSTNEGLDDSRCMNIDNWLYKERMEKYPFFLFFQISGPERCRLKESVGKFLRWCELILFFTVWGPKIPPVLF